MTLQVLAQVSLKPFNSFGIDVRAQLFAEAHSDDDVREALEQLRALWHGVRIHVDDAMEAPPAGVDTPEDLERVRRLLGA